MLVGVAALGHHQILGEMVARRNRQRPTLDRTANSPPYLDHGETGGAAAASASSGKKVRNPLRPDIGYVVVNAAHDIAIFGVSRSSSSAVRKVWSNTSTRAAPLSPSPVLPSRVIDSAHSSSRRSRRPWCNGEQSETVALQREPIGIVAPLRIVTRWGSGLPPPSRWSLPPGVPTR